MSQQSTELSAPGPHSLETFNSLSSWGGFPGSQGGRWLWQVGCSLCTHPPSKDTLPETGGLGENDLEERETSSLRDMSWSLAVGSEGACGDCGLSLLLAQFWEKTDAAQRAQPLKEAGSGDGSCSKSSAHGHPAAASPSSLFFLCCIPQQVKAAGRTERYHSPLFNFNYTEPAGALRAVPAGL